MVRKTIFGVMILLCAAGGWADDSKKTRKHHPGVRLGVLWPWADRLELADSGVTINRAAFQGTLSYRYSVTPTVDLNAELRHWIGQWASASSRRTEAAAGFIGPGIRFHPAHGGRVAPYVQFNVYWVGQQVTLSKMHTGSGWGWGVSGGVDVTVVPWLSIPVEATYLGSTGGAIDDLSGFGLSSGVDFHF